MTGQRRRARDHEDGRPPTAPLDELLDDVRDLRLTLASDLSAAAGAVEIGAESVASDIIAADREEVARFVRNADRQLAGRHRREAARRRPQWRRRAVAAVPAVPLLGAMALSAAAATGVLPVPGMTERSPAPSHAQRTTTTPATSAFAEFANLVDRDPSASQLLAAAEAFHKQLAVMIAASPHDPSQVAQIEQLLRMEQSLLLRRQPPGTPIVLEAAHRLAARLDSVAGTRATATAVPTPTATRTRHHSRATTFSSRPSSTATPATAQPAPTATAPPATTSPTTTSSSSDGFPNVPG